MAARETALQSFQYKVINRYLPCKYNLKIWNKKDNDLCDTCLEVDTIEHYLCECNEVKHFWNNVIEWWNNIYETNMNISTLDTIFGIVNAENDIALYVLNVCILYAKYYIYICKLDSKQITFRVFKQCLKEWMSHEKCIFIE